MRKKFLSSLIIMFAVLGFSTSLNGETVLPDSINSFDYSHNYTVKNPVLGKEVSRRGTTQAVMKRCEAIMQLPEEDFIKLMPEKGGIFFANCPVKGCGNRGEKFTWDFRKPDVLRCVICKNDLTTKKYPENHTAVAVTPEGKKVVYRFHRRKHDNKQCWITSGMDSFKFKYFEQLAVDLGVLYYRTKDVKYARRAAIIIAHLSKAYLNTPYKIEPWLRSPYKEVHFYNGMPSDEEMLDYQRSRPGYWAYSDIPQRLLLAYDFIGGSNGELARYAAEINMDVKRDIIDGYFVKSVESTLRKKEPYGNMSVYVWSSMTIAGIVLGIPEYVHCGVLRVEEFARRGFFFDGAWYEVTSSYHSQCVQAILFFKRIVDGYSDPAGYKSTYDNSNYRNFVLFSNNPGMLRAQSLVNDHMLYPDNIAVAHNDTLYDLKWRWGAPGKISPSNFVSSWRHVALKNSVQPLQTQLRITAAPVSTHRHQDMFNITLWALGRELLGDIGYTHTRYRQFASSLPHHNTVTVDYLLHNWWPSSGSTDRKRSFMATGAMPVESEIRDLGFQFTSFQAEDLYKNVKNQKRTVMLVEIDKANSYAADFFDLDAGGKTYDYFLHGDCASDNLAPLEKGFAPAELLPKSLQKGYDPKRETDKNYRNPGFSYHGFRKTMQHKNPAAVFEGHFRYSQPDAALTVYLAAFGGKRQIFAGNSPSIRRAKENSSRVDKFYRRFYLQRIVAPNGKQVRFSAVMEPHKTDEKHIRKVSAPAPGLLKVELSDRTDYLFNDLKQAVKFDGFTFKGAYGFLSLNKNKKVVNYYLSDASIKSASGSLSAKKAIALTITENVSFDAFKVENLDSLPKDFNKTVVLQLPGEMSAWMFNISSIDRQNNIIKLDRPHGLEFLDDGTIKRTGYLRQTFKAPAKLQIALPEFGKTAQL